MEKTGNEAIDSIIENTKGLEYLFGFGFFIFMAFLLSIYLFPTHVAYFRRIQSVAGVFVINLFLGWTFIFWVLALAWAFSAKRKDRKI